MQIQLTFGQLMNIDVDLRSIMKNNPGLAFLMKDKINNFYAQYKHALNVLPRKEKELLQKHVILDEKGDPKMIEKEDKSFEYIWATPSSKEAFDNDSKEFFKRPVTIIAAV
jgi:hypothetical protein